MSWLIINRGCIQLPQAGSNAWKEQKRTWRAILPLLLQRVPPPGLVSEVRATKFHPLEMRWYNMPLCPFCCCWLFFNLNAHFLLLSTGGSQQASGALTPWDHFSLPFSRWRSSRSSLFRSLIVRNGLSLFPWHIFSLAQWKCVFFVGIIPDPLCLLHWFILILYLINSSILSVPRGKPSVSSLPLRHLHPCLYFWLPCWNLTPPPPKG